MRIAASNAKLLNLIVERGPISSQHMMTGDDNINLTRAIGHSLLDFSDTLRHRGQAGGETGCHRSHRDLRAFQGLDSVRHHRRVYTHSPGGDS